MNDLPYLLAFARHFTISTARVVPRLQKHFPSLREAFFGSALDLRLAGLREESITAFLLHRPQISPELEMEQVEKHGVRLLTRTDAAYPPLLQTIYDPPAVLFLKGTLPPATSPHLAVVGARRSTSYGARMVKKIVSPLAQAGVVIVSGMAYGVDALAHNATLDQKGKTIAVLGGGLDPESIYPRAHRALFNHILESGNAVLSEFPIGIPGLPHHFPLRNRIIAGLSRGTLIVECQRERSGTMITAKSALNQNRDVFAVPGNADTLFSEGPNQLIKDGAIPTTGPEDILNAWNLKTIKEPVAAPHPDETPLEACIRQLLQSQTLSIDEITLETHASAREISIALTRMEMRGSVRDAGARCYTVV